ncbi:arginyl-tRNA synthetase [Dendryphion nanum]|uniref:arginine--tRNA ligase n=1 Tax=Dendryphion nanum TaxID=256645 RepID=A0A9P9E440_9PLEO|nr:arginyl-tRNA synthetase [Dendryphion nanum]
MAALTVPDLEQALKALGLGVPIPKFTPADVINQPLDILRSYLADILCSLVECDHTAAFNSTKLSNDALHGDFTIVLPQLCPGSKPKELAPVLVKKFPGGHPLFAPPWEDGIHLRLCVHIDVLPRLFLPLIQKRGTTFGFDSFVGVQEPSSPESTPRRLLVESSSPNIASEFQGKHLRSTIYGAFTSNIYEKHGWEVTKLNYLGDWGKDIALLGVGWEKFGSEEFFEQDPVAHLLEVYRKIHDLFLPESQASRAARDEAKKKGEDDQEVTAEIESKGIYAERNDFFKRMEDGDETAVAICKRIRQVLVDDYTNFYARLGINFDDYSGESLVSHETMDEFENLLREKGLCQEIGGAWVVDIKTHGLNLEAPKIRDRTGSRTYFLRYLAAVVERSRKYNFDKMIFVAADTNGHFPKLFKVLELLDMAELVDKLQHVPLSDMSQMARKLGSGYHPHMILDQYDKEALESLIANPEKAKVIGTSDNAASMLGISGLLVQETSSKRMSEHNFSISGMTSYKPGSGSDVQYWYSRLRAILDAHPKDIKVSQEEYATLNEEDHLILLLNLGQFPGAVQAALKTLEPLHITTYLHNLIPLLTDFLDDDEEKEETEGQPQGDSDDLEQTATEDTPEETPEEKEEEVISPAQIVLFQAVRQVLDNAMGLLGLTPIPKPEQERVDSPVVE